MPACSLSIDAAVRAAGFDPAKAPGAAKELLTAGWPINRIARLFGLTVSQALALAARSRPEPDAWGMHRGAH
jgi:hypothetical protein